MQDAHALDAQCNLANSNRNLPQRTKAVEATKRNSAVHTMTGVGKGAGQENHTKVAAEETSCAFRSNDAAVNRNFCILVT